MHNQELQHVSIPTISITIINPFLKLLKNIRQFICSCETLLKEYKLTCDCGSDRLPQLSQKLKLDLSHPDLRALMPPLVINLGQERKRAQ